MKWAGLVSLLVLVMGLSLTVGVRDLTLADYVTAITAFDPYDPAHVTLMSIRLPRLLAALIAGGALGMAGSMMQALTRNPLADPGLLGVNAGAAFALILGTTLLGRADQSTIAMLAFPGAAAASAAVFALGGGLRGDAGPVRLTLAGAALNALLLSLVTAVALIRQDSLDILRFWVAGSLSQAAARPLFEMAIAAAIGGGMAWALALRLEALSLGSALARGLGTRPGLVQAATLVAVTLTTGAAVAVAGPIAFLGLMVPPVARRVAGHSLRAELLASAILGGGLLLLADTLGRLILAPAEVRAGIMVALLGAPVFIWIARSLRPGATT
ncbi:FecCD family ABC transporter permease [Puniceibacterium sediminis]|uniref:Iron complex transport system permease protein n=1 Tax=Puniceibacterium sediminis TaxID=1608407 RepID=A0A238WAA1_9RHOB|nr:iron chelate uptake ABC transporter family permease subunit [Puniceibacterium sediminis]SNR43525.1 iron complex transport system permease protein [Puniceibacterium sediminis]